MNRGVVAHMIETRRRTLVKAIAWRLIGILWTWIGAYAILLFTPARYRSAALLSALIVAFHHSTRMAMYYGYERLWDAVAWGRCEAESALASPASWRVTVTWAIVAVIAIVLVLALVLFLTPVVKPCR